MDQTRKQYIDEIADLRRKIKDFENSSSKLPEITHPIKQSDEWFHLLVEQANEAILVIQNEKIRYANTKASEITGFSKEELCARPFIKLIHPDDRKQISFDDIQIRNKGKTSELFTCRIPNKT